MTAAFDAHAAGYDEVASSALGTALRARVHDVLAPHVGQGTRLIDLGCGTGIDLAWARSRGATGFGLDASREMLAVAADRVPGAEVAVVDLDAPGWSRHLDAGFDVALADFGVVNCVADLARFGEELHDVVRPGGVFVAVTMARVVPWELAAAIVRLDPGRLRRRLSARPVASPDHPGLSVRYRTGRLLGRELGRGWHLRQVEALGWALPTFAQRSLVENRTALLHRLARLDARGGVAAAVLGVGDHHIVVLERTP